MTVHKTGHAGLACGVQKRIGAGPGLFKGRLVVRAFLDARIADNSFLHEDSPVLCHQETAHVGSPEGFLTRGGGDLAYIDDEKIALHTAGAPLYRGSLPMEPNRTFA